jgi:hypothetical protein
MSRSSHWLSADTDTAPTWPVWLLPDTLPAEASPLEGLARNRRYGYSADEPFPSPLRLLSRDRRAPHASG